MSKLLNKDFTDFVTHNMLMNYCLWDDEELLIESFVKNNQLILNFSIDEFVMIISGIDKKYLHYDSVEKYEIAVEKALQDYQDIYSLIHDSGYQGNVFLIKVDNSKQTALLVSSVNPCCSYQELAEKIHNYYKHMFGSNHLVFTSLSDVFHGYEGMHKAYLQAHQLNHYSFYQPNCSVITQSYVNKNRHEVNITQFGELIKLYRHYLCLCKYDQSNALLDNEILSALKESFSNELLTHLHYSLISFFTMLSNVTDTNFIQMSQNVPLLTDYLKQIHYIVDKIKQVHKKPISYEILITLDYIKNHYKEDINLTNISEYVHFHPSYLSKEFNRQLKISISDYIVNCRLNNAKQLLETTNLTITDIALASGFTNFRYFSQCFKHQFSISPSQYRASLD